MAALTVVGSRGDPGHQRARTEMVGRRRQLLCLPSPKFAARRSLDNARVTVSGDAGQLRDLLSLSDTFEFWFNIVTPVDMPNQ
jgi:alkyl sulfatase BDS1-like metallo-beta-lactamase superfamily hydrolase